MRVFVGEFLCGGGMLSTPQNQIPSSLLSEGRAMWQALVTDFADWAEVVTPIDPRFGLPGIDLVADVPDAVRCVALELAETVCEQWLRLAKKCDVAILVAPETDGELARLVAAFRDADIDVLAVDEPTMQMASDKWLTAKWLTEHAIPTPLTWSNKDSSTDELKRQSSRLGSVGLTANRWVRKPRDGCGSEAIRVFDDWELACSALQDNEVAQAWIEGRPASILVVGEAKNAIAEPVICPAVWQHCQRRNDDTAADNQSAGRSTHYTGGSGPIDIELQSRGFKLAKQVLQALPASPRGFLGIDFVLGDRPEDDCVIEINPRLTTSYIGVRHLTDQNLTSIWNPSLITEQPEASFSFRTGSNQVRWATSGEVQTDRKSSSDC
ncbi:ATP-grasp domain-containing protein [Rhodopirellula bahusiensis]|uniref:ATP-grasp domain-containing protein n=1 Tax=Rhodopirellula bahusiensis TaxID=2014065 RepID=A0A2G1W3D2_9BACT|nr:ATP-grasp domain-containing protein [Rhodopirellula bahusiensis]PHQ33547.1 hypothetical protein CEE69_19840 [Rhodopirellula bahusiensis]